MQNVNKKEETAATVLPFPGFTPNNDEIIEHLHGKVKAELLDGSALGLPFNWDGIPVELRNRANWFMVRVFEKTDGTLGKTPYYGGSWQDPDAQAPLLDVILLARKKKRKDEIIYPAYVLQPGDGCIDMDNHDTAADPDKRAMHYAHLVNEARGCYAERSVSGSGAHIFGTVLDKTKPFSTKADSVDIQFFAHGNRYMLLTGMLLDGAEPVLKPIIHIVNDIPCESVAEKGAEYKGTCPSQSMTLDDASILGRIKQERPKVTDLLDRPLKGMDYDGKKGSDAFMQLLRDISDFCETHEQVYRIAVNSKAFWHENRTDGKQQNYRTPEKYNELIWSQICKHIEPKGLRDNDVVINLSAEQNKVLPQQLEYTPPYNQRYPVIADLFNYSTICSINASSNVGKTHVLMGLMAIVASGQSLGDRQVIPGHCFLIDGDTGEFEIEKRMAALRHYYGEAVSDKLHTLYMGDFELKEKAGRTRLLNTIIEKAKGEPVAIIGLDTLDALISSVVPDDVRELQTPREVLNFMRWLSDKTGACVITNEHPPKSGLNDINAKGQDSGKIFNGADMSWTMAEVQDDGKNKLIAAKQHKNRIGRKTDFSLVLREVDMLDKLPADHLADIEKAKALRKPLTEREFINPFPDLVSALPQREMTYSTMVLLPEIFTFRAPADKTKSRTTYEGGATEPTPSKKTAVDIIRELAYLHKEGGFTRKDVETALEAYGLKSSGMKVAVSRAKTEGIIVEEGGVLKMAPIGFTPQ